MPLSLAGPHLSPPSPLWAILQPSHLVMLFRRFSRHFLSRYCVAAMASSIRMSSSCWCGKRSSGIGCVRRCVSSRERDPPDRSTAHSVDTLPLVCAMFGHALGGSRVLCVRRGDCSLGHVVSVIRRLCQLSIGHPCGHRTTAVSACVSGQRQASAAAVCGVDSVRVPGWCLS